MNSIIVKLIKSLQYNFIKYPEGLTKERLKYILLTNGQILNNNAIDEMFKFSNKNQITENDIDDFISLNYNDKENHELLNFLQEIFQDSSNTKSEIRKEDLIEFLEIFDLVDENEINMYFPGEFIDYFELTNLLEKFSAN